MGLRLRALRYALFVLVFFAIAALPGSWNHQTPGSSHGPAVAWAGGTPDETLNPPPTPPSGAGKKSSSNYAIGNGPTTVEPATDSVRSAADRGFRWDLAWLIIRTTVLRI
jgi:hypothetical protein